MSDTLNLDDTHELIRIADVLENDAYSDEEKVRIALMDLEDFLARRGFDENPLELNEGDLQIEVAHKEACVQCQTSYSWQLCPTLRKELGK